MFASNVWTEGVNTERTRVMPNPADVGIEDGSTVMMCWERYPGTSAVVCRINNLRDDVAGGHRWTNTERMRDYLWSSRNVTVGSSGHGLHVAEIMIWGGTAYTTALTTSQRTDISIYLSRKWGVSLPVTDRIDHLLPITPIPSELYRWDAQLTSSLVTSGGSIVNGAVVTQWVDSLSGLSLNTAGTGSGTVSVNPAFTCAYGVVSPVGQWFQTASAFDMKEKVVFFVFSQPTKGNTWGMLFGHRPASDLDPTTAYLTLETTSSTVKANPVVGADWGKSGWQRVIDKVGVTGDTFMTVSNDNRRYVIGVRFYQTYDPMRPAITMVHDYDADNVVYSTLAQSATPLAANTTDPLTIAGIPGGYWNTKFTIHEVRVYDGGMNLSEFQLARDELTQKWNRT